MRLTKRFVETAELPAGMPEAYHMDDDVRGFGLRLQRRADGSVLRTYVIRYRKSGSNQRRLKVGEPSRMSLEDARKEARKLLTKADQGGDPIAERKAEIGEPTLAEMAEKFLALHASKRKSKDSIARTLKANILPVLGRKKFKDVTKEDVERLALRITNQGRPITANRTVATLSSLMSYGGRKGAANPCTGVLRNPENKRRRYLSSDELERLGAALEAAEGKDHPSALLAIRLLVLTGCRKNEILTLRWDYVSLERSCLFLPDSKTGAKVVPLGDAALALLAQAPRREGNPYVCWSDKGHLIGLHRIWNRIRIAAGLRDVHLHDLRHTFASVGVGSGVGLPIVGRILGHSNYATTERYAHLADSPVRTAANAISSEILALMSRRSNVVPFRAAS
jgi:integrase